MVHDYKELIRTVLNNIDLMVWVVDRSGSILLSEGKGLQAMGIAPGQLVGTNVFEIYPPEIIANIHRAFTGEEFIASTLTHDRMVENRYAPLRDASGEVVAAVGISFDATERYRTQHALERQAAALKEQAELLDLAHDAIMVRRIDGTITYWNQGAERMYGYTRAEAVGEVAHALLKTTPSKTIKDLGDDLLAQGYSEGEVTHTRRDGSALIVSTRWVLKGGKEGTEAAVLEINTDITARKKAEAEEALARRHEAVIRAQALAIAELSTPLIPITDEILVMPLIGTMDSTRAKQVMESLLGGLSASRGRFAILDITGVAVVDAQVANALVRAAHAARLLGSEVILTGIRPEVARTLVAIGAELGPVTTRGTLQSGIAYALARNRMRHG